jgi:hypothetical protein
VSSHSYSARNRRKIPKVVYLLLQQHHRTRGLAVVGWNKPPGNSYFSFYTLAANRPPPELNVAFDGLLTVYQDSIGTRTAGLGVDISCNTLTVSRRLVLCPVKIDRTGVFR